MWKWFLYASFVWAIVLGQAQTFAVETASQRRMLRLLTGRSEPARAKAVTLLQYQPDLFHENLDIVIQATRELLKQYVNEDDGKAKATKPAERDAVPESVTQLINLLGSSPREDAHSVVIETLGHPDVRIAMVGMDAIGQSGIDEAVDELAAQIKRPEFEELYAFRFALVRAIAQLHCPQGIELLHKLHAQLRGQLRHEIGLRLQKVDLLDFDGDRESYARYCEEHPPESLISRVSFEADNVKPQGTGLQLHDVSSESTGGLKLSKSHYYGIDLNAGRMLFVIDRSGSMKKPAYYTTRLQSAKQELVRVITELPPEAEFSIMLFDTYIQSWKDELLPATEENKLDAIAFTNRILPGDKTNTHGVLSSALEFDDQLEAVFVLTDGQPTTGKIFRPDAIIRDIVGRNRNRHLKFHTIGFGVEGITSEFLATLADQTGGEFREVK
ncbi:VWA domain-containing protein [Aporhodopirellula aestuarii]|uniref:VWA domain-containing protein n=1 Tax=Aporhodopirellula aestuarii TaxID=2950107 RepID=A0ABT0UGA5_9BACT|nr:VWA domain-containing protein [Aporhodopirellula aestuarii]MCM2375158.1 VWA domain-containing protein [Aporhodopirellula aestuarii]